MGARVFHVAGDKYEAGDPILPWDTLVEMGVLTEDDWHWGEAHEGFDGTVVCVYETEAEARDHADEFGGTILTIIVPDDHDDADPILYPNPFGGYIRPRSTRVSEGFRAFENGIPAEWVRNA